MHPSLRAWGPQAPLFFCFCDEACRGDPLGLLSAYTVRHWQQWHAVLTTTTNSNLLVAAAAEESQRAGRATHNHCLDGRPSSPTCHMRVSQRTDRGNRGYRDIVMAPTYDIVTQLGGGTTYAWCTWVHTNSLAHICFIRIGAHTHCAGKWSHVPYIKKACTVCRVSAHDASHHDRGGCPNFRG